MFKKIFIAIPLFAGILGISACGQVDLDQKSIQAIESQTNSPQNNSLLKADGNEDVGETTVVEEAPKPLTLADPGEITKAELPVEIVVTITEVSEEALPPPPPTIEISESPGSVASLDSSK